MCFRIRQIVHALTLLHFLRTLKALYIYPLAPAAAAVAAAAVAAFFAPPAAFHSTNLATPPTRNIAVLNIHEFMVHLAAKVFTQAARAQPYEPPVITA